MGKQFSKDYQPKGRGKAQRTKILEAMQRAGQTEEGFYDLLVQRAFNPEDNFAFKELLGRFYPIPKQTLPLIEFDFDPTATPSLQAAQIMDASAKGVIPPDVASTFISSIASMLKIEEVTELQKRLEAIEKALGADNG